MHMRIVWGRVKPGTWSEFEAAFARMMDAAPNTEGLVARWLVREEADPDAGYVIGLWSSVEAMKAATEKNPDWERLYAEPVKEYFTGEFFKVYGEVRWSRTFPGAGSQQAAD